MKMQMTGAPMSMGCARIRWLIFALIATGAHGVIDSASAHANGGTLEQVLSASALLICVASFVLLSFSGSTSSIDGKNFYALLFFWIGMSLAMNLLNKQSSILLRCPFTLVLIQMLVAVVLLTVARTPLTGLKKEDLWRWSALAGLFGVMLCSSLFAFMHASLTCLVICRNCLPLLALPLEKAILPSGLPISVSMLASLAVIAMGTVLYARNSPSHSASQTGFGWIALNCLATVTHRVLERFLLTSDMKLSFEQMSLVNNLIPMVPIALLAYGTGEIEQWPKYQQLLYSPVDMAVLTCSGVVGLCLGQSSIMVQKCIDATAMLVLQVTNKVFIILGAMLFFNDRFNFASSVGCAMSLLGCAAYGVAQRGAREGSSALQPLLPTVIKTTDAKGEGF